MVPQFHGSLEILLLALFLKSANAFEGHRLFARAAFEDKQAQRPDLELLRVWVFNLRGGPDFVAERTLYKGSQGGLAPDSDRLGLNQEIIRQIERGFLAISHLGYGRDAMVFAIS